MATLPAVNRTILRSRLRRHPDALLISQNIEGEFGKRAIADLSNEELIKTAAAYNVPLPSENEVAAFTAAKAAGQDGKAAIAAADATALTANPVGPMSRIAPITAPLPASVASMVGTDADDTDEADDEADDVNDATRTGAVTTTSPDSAGPTDAEVEKDVKEVMGLLGTGNILGYQEKLRQLARDARKPANIVVKEVRAVDTSKLAGYVAKVIGHKNMREAGLPALPGVALKSTVLPVYDAPDAPAVDPHYNWHPETGVMLSVWRRGQPVFGFGPAGTGKTSLAQQVAARWGRPFVRISCDDQTEAQTLVGMTVPDGEKGVKWQDGQLTAAIRRPGTVILIDEPSVARPGALFVLQSVMDADRKIHIAETGEVVHVAPDVIIMMADNTNGTGDTTGQYEATRRLNRATLDRPDVVVRFDYMTPAEEAKVIAAKTQCHKQVAAILSKFGALTRVRADEGKIAHGVGLRRLLAMGALLADGVEPTRAFQNAILEGAPFDDREPLRQMWTADVDTKTLAQHAATALGAGA